MIYKGIIRSHLDYGPLFIFNTTKRNIYELDKVQFKASRVILGAMKSAPTVSLLTEIGELPLHLKKIWLAEKCINKHISS